jgi:poly(A) polymerase
MRRVYERSTQQDEEETKIIKNVLRHDYNQYESEADTLNRERILAKLNELVREWIKSVGRLENKDEETIEHSGGKIFTFGSYRLGVHAPNTDIDALCVAPRHVDREKHFFTTLVE